MLFSSPFLAAYVIVIAALLGLVMGSFLNCFALRYANGEKVSKGRSHCATCGHTLSGADLIPVFSWLFLKGKCRYCGEKISFRYILAEIICAVMYVSVVLRFDISVETLKYLILVSLLFAVAMTDFYCRLIPDRLIIIGTVAAFTSAFFSESGILSGLLWTLIGGLSISLPLLIVVLVFDKVMNRETMGGGDIKLMFMIGLFFDWKLNILIIISACIIGIIWSVPAKRLEKGDSTFSFGPALSAAAWLIMLCGQPVMDWYLGFF